MDDVVAVAEREQLWRQTAQGDGDVLAKVQHNCPPASIQSLPKLHKGEGGKTMATKTFLEHISAYPSAMRAATWSCRDEADLAWSQFQVI